MKPFQDKLIRDAKAEMISPEVLEMFFELGPWEINQKAVSEAQKEITVSFQSFP